MTSTGTNRGRSHPVATTLQVSAVGSVLLMFVQFVTAGPLLGTGFDLVWLRAHGALSIVLHVVSGVVAVAAAALWRTGGAPAWTAVLAAVVFVLTFVQGAIGTSATMIYHVPGAMVLTVGAVVVAAWSLRDGLSRRAVS